ncbi:MAG: polysaccharide pyruvyl transferase family protein [Caulobacteraceae bacterium]|nr:polysaccharide pyruvyl transferase family protein [Caulobacteraceae bacterium]
MIFDFHARASRKIVFGSGYGGYTALPEFDRTWSFHGVRGPRTAAACGLDARSVAGDTAILIHRYRARPAKSGAGFAFMPHWHSVERGCWAKACELAGVRYIDPAAPVEEILATIEGCGTLIAEAMHGAIVADALRVPWIPLQPLHASHRMKWRDWAEALDLDLRPAALWPSSLGEASVTLRGGKGDGRRLAQARGALGAGVRAVDRGFVQLAAMRLAQLTKVEPMLSSDAALGRAVERLERHAADIRRDYGCGAQWRLAL